MTFIVRCATLKAALICMSVWFACSFAKPCVGSRTYDLKVDLQWTRSADVMRPDSASFSRVVAVAHSQDYMLFEEGAIATDALGGIARSGIFTQFEVTVKQAKKANDVSDYDIVGRTHNSPITSLDLSLELDGDKNATYVSIAARIDPSPAWFVGVQDLQLCNEDTGRFLDDVDDNIVGYTSGLERGTSYLSGRDELKKDDRLPVAKLTDVSIRNFGTLSTHTASTSATIPFWAYIIAGAFVLLLGGVVGLCAFRRVVVKRRRLRRQAVLPSDERESREMWA